LVVLKPNIQAQFPDEARLVTEDQLPHVGVQPVGAHDRIERARTGPLERDPYAVRTLLKTLDRVPEEVLGAARVAS
jgi:hypothetical protein